MPHCTFCNKDFGPDDMHSKDMCDDCFDQVMEQEEKDFDVYFSQDQCCAICKKKLSGWVVIDGKAICWPGCGDKRLSDPIELKIE